MVLKIILVIVIVGGLILLTKWTDKRGWTTFYREGAGGAMLSSALSAYDQILFQEKKAAVEYQKEEKTEQQESGDTH
ncbi:MAG: hypothetical protein ACYC56_00670 [Candidatus Aquicultor sp.]